MAQLVPAEAERRAWPGKLYRRPPGGESWVDVAPRLRTWLADLERGAAALVYLTRWQWQWQWSCWSSPGGGGGRRAGGAVDIVVCTGDDRATPGPGPRPRNHLTDAAIVIDDVFINQEVG